LISVEPFAKDTLLLFPVHYWKAENQTCLEYKSTILDSDDDSDDDSIIEFKHEFSLYIRVDLSPFIDTLIYNIKYSEILQKQIIKSFSSYDNKFNSISVTYIDLPSNYLVSKLYIIIIGHNNVTLKDVYNVLQNKASLYSYANKEYSDVENLYINYIDILHNILSWRVLSRCFIRLLFVFVISLFSFLLSRAI